MTTLVLTGQQFLGVAIVEALVDHGENVVVLNRGSRPPINQVKRLIADRYKLSQLQEVLTDRFDAIVDVSGVDPGMINPILGVPRVALCPTYVYISSAAVYDRLTATPPFHEDDAAGGDVIFGEYGVMKWRCEEVLRKQYRNRLFILRPSYVYGPHNRSRREQFVWSRVLNGLPVPVPGDGLRNMQFCYSNDLARFVVSIIQSPGCDGAVYNIAGDEVLSQIGYVRQVARVAGVIPKIQHIYGDMMDARDYFPFRDADFYFDTSKVKKQLLFQFTPVEEGLKTTLEWFRANRPEDLEPELSVVERPSPGSP